MSVMKKEKLVYVLDDSPIICDLISKVINLDENMKALSFYSSESFLEAHRSCASDLYIIDYFLDSQGEKGTTGNDVIKELRHSNYNPVIVVSGSRELPILIDNINHGNIYAINKDEDDFFDKIESQVQTLLRFKR